MSEEVVVTGIAAGGDGVARLADGRAVFVPRTIPGERVRLRPDRTRLHRRFARGEAAELVTTAPTRVPARCPHYTADACGGCQLQHLDYPAQLEAKRAIVGDALRRIGGLEMADPEIVPADQPWHYRTRISLAVQGGAGRARRIGYHRYDHAGAVFALDECRLADRRIAEVWRALQPWLHVLPETVTRLTLRLDREGRRHIIVESSGEAWQGAAALREALPEPEAVVCWWQPVEGAARVMAGPETGFPATAFEQVNPAMATRVRQWATAALGDLAGRTAWDLYGGIGETALLLAGLGASVVSVDVDESAVAWARRQPVPTGGTIRFIAGRVEDVVPSLPPPAAVVVNPPRAGLHWDVSLRLTAAPVARLVYISCDPATLARDLRRLGVNYHVRRVRAFDLFPQTAHVETVALLEAA